jgi:hypothetical protein
MKQPDPLFAAVESFFIDYLQPHINQVVERSLQTDTFPSQHPPRSEYGCAAMREPDPPAVP